MYYVRFYTQRSKIYNYIYAKKLYDKLAKTFGDNVELVEVKKWAN